MINVGGIIGSGIFMVPATVALYTASSSLFFMVWIIGGIVSLFGALSVAELGAAMPRAGGQYIYLNEAYGPVWGYLYGWSAVAVINTASIAAVGVAFSEYLGFFLSLSELGIKSIAVFSIILLTTINIVDVKSGARFQNGFTFAKIGSITCVILLGLLLKGGSTQNLSPFFIILYCDYERFDLSKPKLSIPISSLEVLGCVFTLSCSHFRYANVTLSLAYSLF